MTAYQVNNETIKLTEYLASRFSQNVSTNLLDICVDEGVGIIIDDYGQYFDGMLVWDGKRFYTHLNSSKGNFPDTKRGRFTLAHELGHFFIDSHREGIKNGLIPAHPSSHSLLHTDQMEKEADYFAACLLMPRDRLRAFTGGRRNFSLDVLKEVSNAFQVSLTAAVLRFVEVGTHGIMVVFSQGNEIKWTTRSEDFPKVANKFKRGGQLPPSSVAGEAFLKSDAKYTTVEKIELEDWFENRGWVPGPLFEQCFYSDLYNYAISMVWFK